MSNKMKVISLSIILLFSFAFINFAKADDATTTDNFLIFRRGNGGGTVTVKNNDLTLITCGDTCTARFNEVLNLNLSAVANAGSIFKGWSVNHDNSSIDPESASSTLNIDTSTSTTLVYAKFDTEKMPDNPVVVSEDRNIPRVMFWPGKVNQHWDLTQGIWATDEDGFSGSRENKLEYCKKFYPTTIKVVSYKDETTNTWKGAGNVVSYASVKPSYRCILEGENVSGDDASNLVSKPDKGSVCYYYPDLPLCLPLSNPNAIRSALAVKLEDFVANGVDANTSKLGSGERVAVLKSYTSAFKALPTTEAEFSDVVKIANGQWPSETSPEMEKVATTEFQKIYKKLPSPNNQNDQAAIKVMAYGLRQKAVNRNTSSEAAALKTFKLVYGRTPTSTLDWNILQGITYSGATREVDSDGDLLSDRRELELGTDPNNKDTDGDGYFDGVEVANGYNPLKDESK